MFRANFKILLGLFVFLVYATDAKAFDPSLPAKLSKKIADLRETKIKGARISFSLVQLSTGKEIFAENAEELMSPASVLKLVTTVAALKVLGSEYQFPTEVFLNKVEGQAPDLIVRGYGDPSFEQQDLLELAQSIRQSGFSKINNIIIDDTLFIDPPAASGIAPYQAALSATSVNNNTFYVAVSPSISGEKAIVSLNPGLDYEVANGVNTLSYKGESFSVTFSPSSETYNPKNYGTRKGLLYLIPEDPVKINASGRIAKSAELVKKFFSVRNPVRYFASLTKHYLQLSGVEVAGQLLKGETPGSANQIYVHKSEALKKILVDMNHFSSNYIAGQLVFALGQDEKGYFKYDLGIQHLKNVLKEIGVEDYVLVDGSGLSIENRISASAVTKLLLEVSKDYTVYPNFISSLGRFGVSGTLAERKLYDSRLKNENPDSADYRNRKIASSVWAKTGTLDGVSSIAGYLQDRDGERMAFSIILNAVADKTTAIFAEDALIKEVLSLSQEQKSVVNANDTNK